MVEEEEEKFVHPPPKRPASAWIFWNTSFCKKYVEDGGERVKAFKAASEAWNLMSEEEKKPYVDKQEQSKQRVEKQRVELGKKGFYTLEDGSKSTDPANSHLLKVKKAKKTKAAAADVKKVPAALSLESDESIEESKQAEPVKPRQKAKKV